MFWCCSDPGQRPAFRNSRVPNRSIRIRVTLKVRPRMEFWLVLQVVWINSTNRNCFNHVSCRASRLCGQLKMKSWNFSLTLTSARQNHRLSQKFERRRPKQTQIRWPAVPAGQSSSALKPLKLPSKSSNDRYLKRLFWGGKSMIGHLLIFFLIRVEKSEF